VRGACAGWERGSEGDAGGGGGSAPRSPAKTVRALLTCASVLPHPEQLDQPCSPLATRSRQRSRNLGACNLVCVLAAQCRLGLVVSSALIPPCTAKQAQRVRNCGVTSEAKCILKVDIAHTLKWKLRRRLMRKRLGAQHIQHRFFQQISRCHGRNAAS